MYVKMFLQKPCDNKTAYKHTGRLAHCHDSRTSPRAVQRSQPHRQCAATFLHHYHLRSGGARRWYSARCPLARRGGKALHRVCSSPAPQISRKRVPLFLKRSSHGVFLALASTRKTKEKLAPGEIWSPGVN